MIYDVNIYIDENSIGKTATKHDFLEVIINLLRLSSAFKADINGMSVQFVLWKCVDLEVKMLCIDETDISFLSAVNQILGTDIKRHFKNVFYDKLSKVWNNEQVHCGDTLYELTSGECVTGGTFAECAELTISSNKHPIAFVNNNVIHGASATVIKGWEEEIRQSIDVELADIKVEPRVWLAQKYNVDDYHYDPTSDSPPTDAQSYLRDSSKYIKTKFINQGRIVYSYPLKRTFHVIDNLHHGQRAHIEVWDRFGKHLGEDDLDGNRVADADSSKNNPAWLR